MWLMELKLLVNVGLGIEDTDIKLHITMENTAINFFKLILLLSNYDVHLQEHVSGSTE